MLDVLQSNRYVGFRLQVIQVIMKDMLNALNAIHRLGIVHCDVKPENIVQLDGISSHVKLIDFGNCLTLGSYEPGYMQTRFYRAPEVVLRLPFDTKADIWSLGCVICELFLGLPILPGMSEVHLVSLIEQTIGPFPPDMIEMSPQKDIYFNPDGTVKPADVLCRENPDYDFSSFEPYFACQGLPNILNSLSFNLNFTEEMIEIETERRRKFISLIQQMLTIDPDDRITAEEALKHPFFNEKFS